MAPKRDKTSARAGKEHKLNAKLKAATKTLVGAVLKQEDQSFVIGTTVNAIVREKLLTGAYANLNQYLTAEILPHAPDLILGSFFDAAAVAGRFSEKVIEDSGPARLRRLITYANLHKLKLPADPKDLPIELPQGDGKTITKPFHECSLADLKRALSHARGKPTPAPAPRPGGKLPPEEQKILDGYSKKLDAFTYDDAHTDEWIAGEYVQGAIFYTMRVSKADFPGACALFADAGPGKRPPRRRR